MERVCEIQSSFRQGAITIEAPGEVSRAILEDKRIILLRSALPVDLLMKARDSVLRWRRDVPAASTNDFKGNYHRQRCQMIKTTAPHVFHDYNFIALDRLDPVIGRPLHALFEPLRRLYNELTGHDVEFGHAESAPYLQPQVIQYPPGGGFFGRHEHAFEPQRIGIIVQMSEAGKDYHGGGTVFEIDGDVIDFEGNSRLGDICLWPFDVPHWVKQSDLSEPFDWQSERGRWVATFPHNNPFGRF